jgi:hypothetical protein
LQISLCDRFPNLSPFDIRKQKFHEVFLLVRRLNKANENKGNSPQIKKVNGKTRCYVPVT